MRKLLAALTVLGTLLLVGLWSSAVAQPAAQPAAKCSSRAMLPDSRCTPGATDPRVRHANIQTTICRSGYTKTVRPPTSVTAPIKSEREVAYGIPGPHPHPFRGEELDHLIALELGGAPRALANLWPEPAPAYRQKDKLETRLKRLVCNGTLKLRVAQRAIAGNWKAAYKRYVPQ